MPMYCPACLEEFRDNMETCADCAVTLVDSREAAEAARHAVAAARPDPEREDPEELPEVSVFVADLEVGEWICEMLIGNHCPAYVDETSGEAPAPFRVAVPEEFAPQASQVLVRQGKKLLAVRTGAGSYYTFRADDSAMPEFSVLALPAEEIEAAGTKHIPDLLEVLVDGEGPQIDAAGARLRALGERGTVAVLDLLARHAAEITEGATIHAYAVLAGSKGEPLPTAFGKMVAAAEDPLARRDLLRVPGLVGDHGVMELLVKHLDDADARVRYEAIDSLWAMTGDSLDYDPDAPAAERAPAIEAWRSRIQ